MDESGDSGILVWLRAHWGHPICLTKGQNEIAVLAMTHQSYTRKYVGIIRELLLNTTNNVFRGKGGKYSQSFRGTAFFDLTPNV